MTTSTTSPEKPVNAAAYLSSAKARPLQVAPADYTPPTAGEIVVRNRAVAVNPLDRIKQDKGDFLYGWLKYPIILGTDLAGEVHEVGEGVTRFKPGDRVFGFANGMDKPRNKRSECAFQLYTVMPENLVSPIPDHLTYEQAATLPLGAATAASGLYEKDQLALPFPTLAPESAGQALIVWGGSTSVGCNATQLAVASGFDVIATSSPRNFDLCKRLGATRVLDYNGKGIVQELIAALEGKPLRGAMVIGNGGAEACGAVMAQVKCDRKFISLVSYPMPDPHPKSFELARTVGYFISWNVRWWISSKLRGIESKFVWGATIAYNEIGQEIFGKYLPGALAEGKFSCAPEAHVVGHRLEKLQEAFDAQKRVSAKKIVVAL